MREIVFMWKYAPLSFGLMIICTFYYLYSLKLAKYEGKSVAAYALGALELNALTKKKQYWRLLTTNLIHVDFWHYLMNMYFIMNLGALIEASLSKGFYCLLLFGSGLGSSLLTYLYDLKHHRSILTFGASGICFGMLGMLLGLLLFHQALASSLIRPVLMMLVINLFYTFFHPQISKTGHIGGLIGGLLVSLLW